MRRATRPACWTVILTASSWPSWSGSPPTWTSALPELRPAAAHDTGALIDVFYRSMDHLAARDRRPVPPRNPGPLEELFRHLIGTDAASAILARDRDRVVAFGMVHVRGGHGFLSFLFVVPEWQGRGVGRAVLASCLDGAGRPDRMAACAAADQPVSTGLYASLGLAPRAPVYVLRGALDVGMLPTLPAGISTRPMDPDVAAGLDDRLLRYRRPQDHAFWLGTERQGWLIEDGTADLVGYGYVHRSGRIGPVAAGDPASLPLILGQLVRSVAPPEGWQVVVPGPAATALPALLAAGLRIDGTPAVYCARDEG